MNEWIVDYKKVLKDNYHHIEKLREIVHTSNEICEGNCFWKHGSTQDAAELLSKQANLFHFSQQAASVMEIGFNAGHACLIFLLSNPNSKIQLFDIGEHGYTRSCFKYLESCFPNRLNIIYGDSTITVPQFLLDNPHTRFDVIHIDGGHQSHVVQADINNCKKLANETNIVISDDDHFPNIHLLNRQYVESQEWVQVPALETELYPHFVARFVK